jgi:hypothetical protein
MFLLALVVWSALILGSYLSRKAQLYKWDCLRIGGKLIAGSKRTCFLLASGGIGARNELVEARDLFRHGFRIL